MSLCFVSVFECFVTLGAPPRGKVSHKPPACGPIGACFRMVHRDRQHCPCVLTGLVRAAWFWAPLGTDGRVYSNGLEHLCGSLQFAWPGGFGAVYWWANSRQSLGRFHSASDAVRSGQAFPCLYPQPMAFSIVTPGGRRRIQWHSLLVFLLSLGALRFSWGWGAPWTAWPTNRAKILGSRGFSRSPKVMGTFAGHPQMAVGRVYPSVLQLSVGCTRS